MKEEITREEAIFTLNALKEEITELRKRRNLLMEQKDKLFYEVDLIEKETKKLDLLKEKIRKSNLEILPILIKLCICLLFMLISIENMRAALTTSNSFLPFQMSYVLLVSSTLLEVYYTRNLFQSGKELNKIFSQAEKKNDELLNQLDKVIAKSTELNQLLKQVLILLFEKEKEARLLTETIEKLGLEDDLNKEKTQVTDEKHISNMTTMIENEDEFTKENKQVKVKTKK